MKKWLLFIFLLSFGFVWGQGKKLDSLWAVYKNKNEVDTNRLNAIYGIVCTIYNNTPDSALLLAEEQRSHVLVRTANVTSSTRTRTINCISSSINREVS